MESVVAHSRRGDHAMHIQDWFVGGASATVGVIFWYWAIVDAEIAQRLKLARLASSVSGRGGARVFLAILGTILVLLGGVIASGYTFELIG
jgi:hypothetical protein